MACSWPTNKQFSVATLILKYEILHKIGVANCFPSTHMATISIALAQLIFISHILRHVNTYAINIPICFPHLINGFLLSIHQEVLADGEVVGPAPQIISLSYKLFQGSHVSDLPATFHPPRRGFSSSGVDLQVPVVGLHLSHDLAIRVVQLLSDESRALSVILEEVQRVQASLTGCCTVVDAVLNAFRARIAES
uniref:Flocculation protein FLO11-like n=1 Tax=Cucumis melo TaxID=3656 RepID=A0A9I9DGG1_CUCME